MTHARRADIVTSCYVSRGMGVRKVSNSESDLQGHSRASAIVPFDRPHTQRIRYEHSQPITLAAVLRRLYVRLSV